MCVQPCDEAAAKKLEPTAPSSDESLFRHLQDGSEDAATALHERFAGRVKALAKRGCGPELAQRLDPEDIVQSVFRSFFHAAKRGFYEAPTSEELWKILVVITLNKMRTQRAYHRAAKRDVRLTPGDCEIALQGVPDGKVDHVLLQLAVQEALEGLPPLPRDIANLRLEGFEVAQIAEKLGRSKRSVERVLHGLRDLLRNFFDASS
ncbi:MAG TPA: sigma-70 family RNA polymerase sigma factor [Gemmataceae bacterium]|jgi:RNA polymerase sigma-70 factor (ECF subfamily)|nr:sigma-70 family RNA polymerase sigma factor [Gemmataceae bacterium]